MYKNNSSPRGKMQRHFIYLILIFAAGFSMTSCRITQEAVYFKTLKKDTTIRGFVTDDFESKIKPGDNLSIVATSLSREEDLIFNQAAGENSNVAGTTSGPGFLVRPDGTILVHRIGATTAAGLTRKELAQKLQKDLVPYMKDPIVNVNYNNHKVTIMGSVNKPQVLTFSAEQLPLIDALVASGDVKTESNLRDILIIREKGTEKIVKHINLEDHSILTSPWYYVQPNDIVYVIEDTKRKEMMERRNSLRTTLSLVASGISLVIIIIDRVIK